MAQESDSDVLSGASCWFALELGASSHACVGCLRLVPAYCLVPAYRTNSAGALHPGWHACAVLWRIMQPGISAHVPAYCTGVLYRQCGRTAPGLACMRGSVAHNAARHLGTWHNSLQCMPLPLPLPPKLLQAPHFVHRLCVPPPRIACVHSECVQTACVRPAGHLPAQVEVQLHDQALHNC